MYDPHLKCNNLFRLISNIVLLFVVHGAHAQILSNNPPSVNWQKINTPHFQIIFSDDFEREGQRMANTLEHIYEPASITLGVTPSKIPVIMQNRYVISNGFVTVGPRRSEFYTTPPQDYNFLGTNDWLDLLALHEYRHVVQFDKAKQGGAGVFYYLFGEEMWGVMSFLGVSNWFWEGDAVAMETALSPSGRGRIPEFDLLFRTNLLERGAYKYAKQYMGSFKDAVPSYYVTGYHMVTHFRRHYRADIWEDITQKAFILPFVPYTMSWGMYEETGETLPQGYNNMIGEVDSLWTKQQVGLDVTDAIQVNHQNKIFTNYRYPQLTSSGDLVVLRSGLGDIQQFIQLDDEGEAEVLFTPGFMNNAGMLSVEDNRIVWSEYHYDRRWRAVSYSVIKSYDLKTGQVRQITEKSRYGAPALSPDGAQIVTVATDASYNHRVKVLDAQTGAIDKEMPNPNNAFYAMPRWSGDGEKIAVLKTTDAGKTIAVIDAASGTEKTLFPPSQENYGHPVIYGDYLLYNSPFMGIDNIYAYHLKTKEHFQITSRKYGAYNPEVSPDGQWLYFNDFSQDGMNVVKMPFDPASWKPKHQVKDRRIHYYQPLVEQENNAHILDSVPDKSYPVEDYKKLSGLRPYRWGPYVSQNNITTLNIGVRAQDRLSNYNVGTGYLYNYAEDRGRYYFDISYQELFPIIDFSFSTGGRQTQLEVNARQIFDKDTLITDTVRWNETNVNLGVRIPLLLTDNRYAEGLTLGVEGGYSYVKDLSHTISFPGIPIDYASINSPSLQESGNLFTLDYALQYYHLLKQSKRDVKSRWGQQLSLRYIHSPSPGLSFNDYDTRLFSANASANFPGIFKHHVTTLRGTFIDQKVASSEGEILYSSYSGFYPRGYGYSAFENFYGGALEYALPLLYPDLEITSAFYFQRIRANVFYDIGYGVSPDSENLFYSYGAEIMVNFNFLRQVIPLFDLGLRVAHAQETGDTVYELVVGSIGI